MSDAERASRGFFVTMLVIGGAFIAATLWVSQDAATIDVHQGVAMPAPGTPAAERPRPAEPPWLTERRTQAEQALEADPNDLDALNTLTQIWLPEPGKAMAYNSRALELAPADADALTLKAALASMVGMHDKALQRIDEVLAAHPDHPRALTYKGLISLEAGKYDDAIAALEQVIQMTGEDPGIRAALVQARQAKGGGAAPGADVVVSGTIAIDPAKEGTLGTAVYVSVRDPAGGPPLAALRLPPGPFPLTFQVTSADAIAMGGAPRPFPAVVDVSVRLDQDGNAMTKVEGEPQALLSGTAAGSTGLSVTLQ